MGTGPRNGGLFECMRKQAREVEREREGKG